MVRRAGGGRTCSSLGVAFFCFERSSLESKRRAGPGQDRTEGKGPLSAVCLAGRFPVGSIWRSVLWILLFLLLLASAWTLRRRRARQSSETLRLRPGQA